jgi:hypothetical protein
MSSYRERMAILPLLPVLLRPYWSRGDFPPWLVNLILILSLRLPYGPLLKVKKWRQAASFA